jgi:hypothetical protein
VYRRHRKDDEEDGILGGNEIKVEEEVENILLARPRPRER